MENYRSDISESSTKRLFNKIGQSFKRSNINKYHEFYASPAQQCVVAPYSASLQLPNPYSNNLTAKISILPLLQNAGLQIEKLNEEVIKALNQINIIDDISENVYNNEKQKYENIKSQQEYTSPINKRETNIKNYTDEDSVEVNIGYLDHYSTNKIRNSVDQIPLGSNNKNNNNNNFYLPSSFESDLYSGRLNKTQGIVIQSEICGNFERFQSEKTWKERKKQYNFKEVPRHDIISEEILKTIDEVLKVKNKERKLISQLIGNFEKFLSLQNNLYLNKDATNVILNFIKLLEIESFALNSSSQIIESLQNFIFGVYVREGTVKKCHSSLVTSGNRVEVSPVNNNTNLDLSFYYEEFGKVKKNFQEDSKNYVDYIAHCGSVFLLNWFADMQNTFLKKQVVLNKMYLERFEYLYKLYPEHMIGKLSNYELSYMKSNWKVFETYLDTPLLHLKSQIKKSDHKENESVFQHEINSNQVKSILPKSKKTRSNRFKPTVPKFNQDDSDDPSQIEFNDKSLRDNVLVNSDPKRAIGIVSKMKEAENLHNKNGNFESATAVDNNNKENEFSPNLKENNPKHYVIYNPKDNPVFNESNNISDAINRIVLESSF